MWVTDPQSPSSSTPSTPSHSTFYIPLTPVTNNATGNSQPPTTIPNAPVTSPSFGPVPLILSSPPTPHFTQPHPPPSSTQFPPSISSSIQASSVPGTRLSGRLVGVVSLTDILYLYARASGLSPDDPNIFRSRRRRSSSCSLGFMKSGDVGKEIWNRGAGP